MPTYLLTIASALAVPNGVRLSPGIRSSETSERPAIGKMMQGAPLELRCRSGERYQTTLITYGVEATRGEDGAICISSNPADPEIKLTVSADLPTAALAPGTEVWLLLD